MRTRPGVSCPLGATWDGSGVNFALFSEHAINAHHEPVPFVLPAHHRGVSWEPILDTRLPNGRQRQAPLRRGERYVLEGRSMALLRLAPKNGRKRMPGRREVRQAPERAKATEPTRALAAERSLATAETR